MQLILFTLKVFMVIVPVTNKQMFNESQKVDMGDHVEERGSCSMHNISFSPTKYHGYYTHSY